MAALVAAMVATATEVVDHLIEEMTVMGVVDSLTEEIEEVIVVDLLVRPRW